MDEIINNQQQSDCSDKLVLRTEGLVKRYGKELSPMVLPSM